MKFSLSLNYVASFLFILLFTNCKKETSTTNASEQDVSTSMQKIVGKYSNLTISNAPTSLSGKETVVEVKSLKEFEEAVAHLSELASSIKVESHPTATIKSSSLTLLEKKQTTELIPLDGGASYAWVGSQWVGSTVAGDYQVSYYATFFYSATGSPAVNIISSISGLSSFSGDASFEASHFPGYYVYTYSYTPVSANGGIVTQGQVGSLSYSGTVSLSCVYHYLMGSQLVSATSAPLSYNTQVFASSFPSLIP